MEASVRERVRGVPTCLRNFREVDLVYPQDSHMIRIGCWWQRPDSGFKVCFRADGFWISGFQVVFLLCVFCGLGLWGLKF